MIQVKRFSGVLNNDYKEADLLPSEHFHAKNIRFTGGGQGLTAQNIKGTVLISNTNLPAGTNENNGSWFDPVRQRILWFNYNQYGAHGLYSYSIQTETVTQLFRCFVNSATDILGLSLDYPVCSAGIVYREESEGDLFYWTNASARPMCIVLDATTITSLSPYTSDMINAGKNAPLAPPTLAYADDATNNVNNLRRLLFRAIYRWVYKDGSKSTWSPISKEAFNSTGYNPNTDNDPTKNNLIEITVTGGGNDYQAIEIGGQFNVNNIWGDFFIIDSLDRTEYSISPGATFVYDFYNNGAYPGISPEETDLYYSWLPDKANALELLNGDVLIYSGITEGYDKIERSDVDVTVTVGLTAPNVPNISYAYTGAHEIMIFIGATIQTGAVYSVFFVYSSGAGGDASPKNVTLSTIAGSTQNSIAASLASALTGSNITATNLGAGYIRVITSTGSGSISNVIVGVTGVNNTQISAQSWKPSCPVRTGLVYFDDRGKTNGVVSFVGDATDTTDFAATTPNFGTSNNIIQVPFVSASINHTPPTWATAYQWVRANLLPTKFLYWVTNDYYAENDYLYFCIQNLIDTGVKNTGFVPSYDFQKGDRIRVVASYSSGNFTPYTPQLDMEIVGVVQKVMHSPATNGTFIKTVRPTTLPSAAYQYYMLIELYTPRATNSDETQVFYEWGEKYNIYESGGIRYHRGQLSDQTASQPATFQWFDGDVYFRPRTYYESASPSVITLTKYFFDANYSDYFASAVNSNGRGWQIEENAKQVYNGVLSRWGGKFEQGTNLNSLNIFRPNDKDEADRGKGDIRRTKIRDRILRVFQDYGIGQYGVYTTFVRKNEGEADLLTTNEIITTNNIQYYQGNYGIGGYPTNLCSSPIADYLTDIVTGRGIRLSGDGITDLGVLYKGQYTFPQFVTPYNKTLLRSNGSTAKVMAFFDSFDGDFHTILQAGTANGTTTTNKHFNFNEPRNGYVCDDIDIHPDWAICANDVNYYWSGGHFYKQTNVNQYCNFFGVQYSSEITVVFNDNLIEKKSWNSISQLASSTWAAPSIYGNVNSYSGQRQETNLVDAEFTVLEGMPSSAIKRDANSPGGKINGSFMKANWLAIKFQKLNANNLITFTEVSVRATNSPLTPA